MKNFSSFGRSLQFMLLAAVCGGMLFSACHKDDDEETMPPVVPEVKATYAIHGIVTDINNEAVEGATVKISGTATSEAAADDAGSFSISSLEKKGNYTVEVSKAGYTSVSKEINLNASLVDVAIQLPFEPVVVTAKATEESKLELPAENSSIATGVELQIPAGALKEDTEVKVTEVPDDTEGDAPLIVLNYQPDGTKFEKPCPLIIPSPTDDYELEGIKLQWLNPDTKKWEDQPQEVEFKDNAYVTSIQHFSSYKITGFSQGSSSTAKETILNDSHDNLNGRGPIEVKEIPYSYKRGTMYVTTPEAAAAAAGITNKKVIDFIKSAVYASTSFTEIDAAYPVSVTIPVGVRMDAKGTQEFTTTAYTFNLKKGGKKYTIQLSTKTAGAVSINTSFYTKEHAGGTL